MTELERECTMHLLDRFDKLSAETKSILQLETDPQVLSLCKIMWERDFYKSRAHELA